jgi:hypothetical protein
VVSLSFIPSFIYSVLYNWANLVTQRQVNTNGKRISIQNLLVLVLWEGRIQAEHVGIIKFIESFKLQKEHGRTRRKLGAERASFSFPGAFKTYASLWEGKNLVSSNHQ